MESLSQNKRFSNKKKPKILIRVYIFQEIVTFKKNNFVKKICDSKPSKKHEFSVLFSYFSQCLYFKSKKRKNSFFESQKPVSISFLLFRNLRNEKDGIQKKERRNF
jgi:hypothetical protein